MLLRWIIKTFSNYIFAKVDELFFWLKQIGVQNILSCCEDNSMHFRHCTLKLIKEFFLKIFVDFLPMFYFLLHNVMNEY
jgi:hypothetical protein